jgi:asparagine synthase (glutamine-hydrolysing)
LTFDHSVAANENLRPSRNSRYPPFTTVALEDAFEERDAFIDDAPQALIDTSSLESAAAVSTLYLHSGIWPVSPLCTPELVQFCRRLPFAWRHERVIERKVLTAFGCSATVAYPKPRHLENFYDVMDFALREASCGTITKLFRNSRLAEQGLVDRDALVATYDQHRRKSSRYGDAILGAVVLELTVRSIERNITPTSCPDRSD